MENLCIKNININHINKLYKNLKVIIVFENKFNFKKDTIYFDKNSLKILKYINSGTYGDIHLCYYNNKICVIKNIKHNNITSKETIKYLNYSFFRENIIHSLLYCNIPKYIPQIYNIVKGIDTYKKSESILLIMQKLDCDIYKFFENNKKSYSRELNMIGLIAHVLDTFQNKFKLFLHNDLHAGNIMLSYSDKTIKTRVSKDFYLHHKYKLYLIDFGFCCVKINDLICVNNKNINVYNRGHDMRLCLISILYHLNDNISLRLKMLLKKLFKPYTSTSKFKKLIHKDIYKAHLYFYDDVYENIDENFYPENVLKYIIKELNALRSVKN
jgi:hypothetical protein